MLCVLCIFLPTIATFETRRPSVVSKLDSTSSTILELPKILNYDLVADTTDDNLLITLMVRATEKDDLTRFEARKSNEYDLFRNAALSGI